MAHIKYVVVKGSVNGNDLDGYFIVDSNFKEENPDPESHTVQYKITNFDFTDGTGAFKGNSGFLEKNIGSGMTAFTFSSGSDSFSGDYEIDVTGFSDNFKPLPDCIALFKRLQGGDDPVPGIGCLDQDCFGQYKIQFSKDKEIALPGTPEGVSLS